MPESPACGRSLKIAVCLGTWMCCCALGIVRADHLRLKNGVEISGTISKVTALDPYRQSQFGELPSLVVTMVDDGMRRYFVPSRQVEEAVQAADLSRYDKFTLEQERTSTVKTLQQIGRAMEVDGWDKFGRRRIRLQTRREPLDVVQVVTEIGPKTVQVRALDLNWEFGLSTTAIPDEQLDAMLRQATDPGDLKDRLSIARFYLQAEMYRQAQAEMETIIQDFPSASNEVEQFALELRALLGDQLLLELRRRIAAGQHQLAYEAIRQFPTDRMSAAVLREVGELQEQQRRNREQLNLVKMLLGDLQAGIEDQELLPLVAPLRSAVNNVLDEESLPRLDAFLNLMQDETLSAGEKLGLAYSGWVVGSAAAVPDLPAAIRLWEARFHITEYLRTENPELRAQTLDRLLNVEGVSAERVRQLLQRLPPVVESPDLQPGVPARIELAPKGTDAPIHYSVLLPHEYNPHHVYPLIIALRDAGQSCDRELQWWGGTAESPGQSQRHGYIVIAPEYADEQQRQYDSTARVHDVVLSAFRDAKLRFPIDSDRVFLAGHGMGGDAVFDLGMSHPDLFAGAIPITGVIRHPCMYYWRNAEPLAWYVVAGERDRDTFEQNMRELNRMLTHGFDLIYVEYMQRGYESYYEEIHRLFDWMEKQRRAPVPKEFEVKTMRPSENQFYWLTAQGFPARLQQGLQPGQVRGVTVKPMTLSGNVNQANTVSVKSFADVNTLWLSRDLVNFEERVRVYVNSRSRYSDFVTDDIEAMLDDFWMRADRQRINSVRMVFD